MKILNQIIEECIELNALFTTYDIIPEAHARGCTLSLETISQYIKNYRYPIFYTRTVRELGCEITVPIYHPADVDASEYDASDIMPKSSQTEISKDVSEIITQSTKKIIEEKNKLQINSDKSKSNLFDKRGRYHVKVDDVEKAGFEIGEKVSIMIDKEDNSLVITNKRKSKRFSQIGGVKVDRYKNISVSKSPFRKINNNKTPIDIVVTSSKREIKIIPRC